ncbi:YceI family protein [Flavobacteriaceae bacterium TP-CH-4]|uniref:YceI family protein n=1 Tax=Pelagihabitans pacificus TaxID=2696054 RepID=A0A967ATH2_9FLAO|nr:YceI family protein [Pelagihabitans pacificus]NHF59632.1 YceI family protein [Pelagihabitans pacificus]
MKKGNNRVLIWLMVLMVLSCKQSGTKDQSTATGPATAKSGQPYSIDTSETVLQWTAYKFTNRAAVNGTFSDFVLFTKGTSETTNVLSPGDSIVINTLSVDTGNGIRDDKLRRYFFQVLHSDTIKGTILEAGEETGKMSLEINALSNTVDYRYSRKKDTLILTTGIDLSDWEGEEAINSLNRECYELHMGPDGISKLWPTIDISLKLPMKIDSVAR